MFRRILFYSMSVLLAFASAEAVAQDDVDSTTFVVDASDALEQNVEDALAERLRQHQRESGVFVRIVIFEADDQNRARAVDEYAEAASDASKHGGRWLLGVTDPAGESAAIRVGSMLSDTMPRSRAIAVIESAFRESAADDSTFPVVLGDALIAQTNHLEAPEPALPEYTLDRPLERPKLVFWLLFVPGLLSTMITSTLIKREWSLFGTKAARAVEIVLVGLFSALCATVFLETAVWAAPLAFLSGGVTGWLLFHGIDPVKLVAAMATIGNLGVQYLAVNLFWASDLAFDLELAGLAGVQVALLLVVALVIFTGRRSVDPDDFEYDPRDGLLR